MSALVHAGYAAGLATLTLDSPHNRNALSTAMIEALLAGIDTAVADDSVRAVVISHTGPVFCSGADLNETRAAQERLEREPQAAANLPVVRLGELLAAVWDCPKPVLVRAGGPARAGGLGLIAAADIAICRVDATFAFTEVRLGVVPAVISATVIPRLTPRAAAELYLTGDTFDGQRAAEIGLVTAAVPVDELDAVVARYAESLCRGAPGALAEAKRLARRHPGASIADDLAELTALSVASFTSAEGREGVRARATKRDPSWFIPS